MFVIILVLSETSLRLRLVDIVLLHPDDTRLNTS